MVQEIVTLDVETFAETFEMTGGVGLAFTARVVNCCGEPYAVSPDEVLEIAW